MKPFLKWAGNKKRLIEKIKIFLPESETIIEPFAGSAAVFLNTDYQNYILSDCNSDLINVYKMLKRYRGRFIRDCAHYFSADYNSEEQYYQLRDRFNASNDPYERAALFIYFNKHGYNGLCRYNASGGFNVPFGRYVKPYFPEQEMRYFLRKAPLAQFICTDFSNTMLKAKAGDVVYCDPPYVPLSPTAQFTQYQPQKFGQTQQEQLAQLAQQLANNGVHVILSNHDTPYTRQLYQNAELNRFKVRRSISCDGQMRAFAPELLAYFKPKFNIS